MREFHSTFGDVSFRSMTDEEKLSDPVWRAANPVLAEALDAASATTAVAEVQQQGGRFCGQCGTDADASKSRFCTSCGAALD